MWSVLPQAIVCYFHISMLSQLKYRFAVLVSIHRSHAFFFIVIYHLHTEGISQQKKKIIKKSLM